MNVCRTLKSGSGRKHDTSFKFEIREMRRVGEEKKKKKKKKKEKKK